MEIQLIDTAIHISKQILLKLLFKFPNNSIVYFNFNNIDFKVQNNNCYKNRGNNKHLGPIVII